MKILIVLFSFIFLLALEASSQHKGLQSSDDTLSLETKIRRHNSIVLSGFGDSSTEIQESFYLDPAWSVATVRFYPRTIGTSKGTIKLDSVSDVLIRVLLKGNDVEFNTPEGVKVISGNLIKNFFISQNGSLVRRYINTQEFTDNNDVVKSGFFEVLADGNLKLLEYSKLKIQQSDRMQAFNIESKSATTETEKLLFVAKGKEVVKFNAGKRGLYALMADKKPEIEKFVKENRLSLKDRIHLTKIFHYFNSL